MATRRRTGTGGPPPRSAPYQQLLLFPERAEYLGQAQFKGYNVRLEHWQELSAAFKDVFEAVYVRQSAAILLVHGVQGTGKTLFAHKLAEDFRAAKTRVEQSGVTTGGKSNLWHVLSGGTPADDTVVSEVTRGTDLRTIEARAGWLEAERQFARENRQRMRVFIADDFHRDVFLRELADLSQGEYLRFKADSSVSTILGSVAQRLVEDCRGDFKRSLFVLFSNDLDFLRQLLEELDRSHRGLAKLLSLPLPEPHLKEEIVRTNTNRLNRRSYWYCLDQGGPDDKLAAYDTLCGDAGFIDAFQAIDAALSAGASRRPGRPANKNLLTLVTLGSPPIGIQSFLDDHEMTPTEVLRTDSVATWLFRGEWASALTKGDDVEYARRAGLVESEFWLRWVALDIAATWQLCEGNSGDLMDDLTSIVTYLPQIGQRKGDEQVPGRMTSVDARIRAVATNPSMQTFAREFERAGQQRAHSIYEPALRRIFDGSPFSVGLSALRAVKPDVILGEYEPCAVTRAERRDSKLIEKAIRRGCHVLEFTSFVQADLAGLDSYMRDKVLNYASLLESV